MLAIQDGKSADHINKYSNVPSMVKNDDGTVLDVAALANTASSSSPSEPEMKREPRLSDVKLEEPIPEPHPRPVQCAGTSPPAAAACSGSAPMLAPCSLSMRSSPPAQQTTASGAGLALTPPYSNLHSCPPNVVRQSAVWCRSACVCTLVVDVLLAVG